MGGAVALFGGRRRVEELAAGSHLLEFTETVEALEWRASGATTTLAPLPPTTPPSQLPSEDAEDTPEPNETDTPALRELSPGRPVPLDGVQHLRLLLQIDDDRDAEIDPIAFLLAEGVVRADDDMVFYGQPDHPTGAVTLAADDTGAPTALHITPAHLPHDVTEILLVAQLPASHTHPPVLDALDLDTGRPIGLLQLPTPGPTGLLQLGALHRADHGWELQPQPARLDHDLAGLATAAGIDVA